MVQKLVKAAISWILAHCQIHWWIADRPAGVKILVHDVPMVQDRFIIIQLVVSDSTIFLGYIQTC